MARNVTVNITAAYRGRRSFQALRQDTLSSAKSMAMVGSASINASKQFGDSLDRMSRRLLRFGQVTAFIMTGLVVKSFATAGASFEKAMSGVQAVTDGTTFQFRRLSDQAEELGKTTQFTATESAQAMEKLALAGFTLNEVYDLTPVVLNLAAAGMLNMDEAATIASGTIRGFGLDIADFQSAVDVMAFTANRSNQTLRDLGTAFSFVGPVAAAAGVSFNQTNAALAILANRNLRAERGGTSLRRILAVLMGDLEEGEKGLAKYNLRLKDTESGSIDLAHALDVINAAGIPVFEQFKAFGLRGGPAFISMMEAGSEAIRNFEVRLALAGGTAAEVAGKRLNNLAGDMVKLRSAIAGVGLDIFQRFSPALRKAAQSARDFVSTMSPESIQRIASSIALLSKAVGLLVVSLLTLRGVAAFTGMVAAIKLASKAMGALTFRTVAYNATLMMATKRTIAFNLASLKIGGIAAAVGLGTFALTRFVMTATGADSKVTKVFEALTQDSEDMARQLQLVDQTIEGINRTLDKFGATGIGIPGLDESVLVDASAAVTRYRDEVERLENLEWVTDSQRFALRGMFNDAMNMADSTMQINRAVQDVAQALDRVRRVSPEVYTAAVFQGGTLEEIYNRIPGLVKEHVEELRVAEVQLKRLVEITTKVGEATRKLLAGEGFFDSASLKDAIAAFTGVGVVIGDGIDKVARMKIVAAEMGDTFRHALKEINRSVIPVDMSLLAFIVDMVQLADELDVATKRTEDLEEAWSTLGSGLAQVDLVSHSQIAEFSDKLEHIFKVATEEGVSAAHVLETMADEMVRVANAADNSGKSLTPFLAQFNAIAQYLVIMRQAREDMKTSDKDDADAAAREIEAAGRKHAAAVKSAWSTMESGLAGIGRISQSGIDAFTEKFGLAMTEAVARGEDLSQVLIAFAAEYEDVARRAGASGLEMAESMNITGPIMEAIFAVRELREEYVETMEEMDTLRQDFHENWRNNWTNFRDSAIASTADVIATMIVDLDSSGKMIQNLFKGIIKQGISMLIQWGIQSLIFKKLMITGTAAQHATQLSGSLAAVYANTFASIAAIPYIGPALAPAAATLALGLATTGAGTAMGIGAAMGAGTLAFGTLAEGGVVTGPMQGLIGEAGPELIAPLQGPGAKRFLDKFFPQQSSGMVVKVYQTFTGDNWTADGVNPELIDAVTEGQRSAIRSGRSLAMPTGVR